MKILSWLLRQWFKTFFISLVLSLLITVIVDFKFQVMSVPYYFVGNIMISCLSTGMLLNVIAGIRYNALLSAMTWFLIPALAYLYLYKELRDNWPQHKSDFIMYTTIYASYTLVHLYFFL